MTSDTLIVFRTHLWDEGVDFCARCLQRSTASRIVVAADETNGPVPVPPEFEKIIHTVDTFAEMGLPLLPDRKSLMWHCGDYPLYQIARAIPARHYLMIEGDLALTGPVDEMLGRLVADGVDYATSDFKETNAPQYGKTRELLALTYPEDGGKTPLFEGSFPAVFLSRDLIDVMFRERIHMAEAGGTPDIWIYCEYFTPIVANRFGFKTTALHRYANTSRQSWELPVQPEDVSAEEDGTVRLAHPVLYSPKWERKMIQHLSRQNMKLKQSVKRLRHLRSGLEEELRACRKG